MTPISGAGPWLWSPFVLVVTCQTSCIDTATGGFRKNHDFFVQEDVESCCLVVTCQTGVSLKKYEFSVQEDEMRCGWEAPVLGAVKRVDQCFSTPINLIRHLLPRLTTFS